MKIKYISLAAYYLLLTVIWARWAGLSRSPQHALERASANSVFSDEFISVKIKDHLRTKGFSPRSCGLLYSTEEEGYAAEIDSVRDEALLREFEKDDYPPLNLLCMDCPMYFKLHSKFGFYWVSIEP
ncbi:MAG: hypothetical protein IPO40_09250 [Fibrobacteres bacterium]|nr:hypothetical protein [Fibrobacterota bacterium]